MSLWEFNVAADGWATANGADEKPSFLSEEEHDRLVEKYGGDDFG